MAGKVHAPYVISRRHQVRVHPATMRRRGIEALERYIEAEFLQPFLDLSCVRGLSEHPGATAHCDQGILARTSTGNA